MTTQAKRSITIEDVARTAGVSRAAVSKVIRDAYGVSDEMRARVQAAITELGYRPRASARAMRGSSYTIGIEIPTINNHFFPKIITGAAGALAGTSYQLIIAPAGPNHDGGPQAIEVLADRQVDGILAISPAVAPEWLEDLAQRTPLVMLGRHDDSVFYDTIVDDDIEGARLAVRHLYDLGHRDIVHLTINPEAEDHLTTAPHAVRSRGYELAMAELGLEDRARVVHVEPNEVGARETSLRAAPRGAPPHGDLRRPRRARPRRAPGDRGTGAQRRRRLGHRLRRHRHRRPPAGVDEQHQPVRHPDGRDRRPPAAGAHRRPHRRRSTRSSLRS